MPDRLTKILLSAVATGLRMNVAVQMFHPQTAIAQGGAESYLLLMESTRHCKRKVSKSKNLLVLFQEF